MTFVTDVAQCLTVAGEDGPAAKLMLRDGSAIQQLIARRHGAQRAALGVINHLLDAAEGEALEAFRSARGG